MKIFYCIFKRLCAVTEEPESDLSAGDGAVRPQGREVSAGNRNAVYGEAAKVEIFLAPAVADVAAEIVAAPAVDWSRRRKQRSFERHTGVAGQAMPKAARAVAMRRSN